VKSKLCIRLDLGFNGANVSTKLYRLGSPLKVVLCALCLILKFELACPCSLKLGYACNVHSTLFVPSSNL
jgi:hypothetical protein